MREEVKLYTDIECFTREFSFIRSQYCMPYFKQNYKEEHKIYKQYEILITKMFKKLYDYEQENKQLKENISYYKGFIEPLDKENRELRDKLTYYQNEFM